MAKGQELLINGINKLGLEISEIQISQFMDYYNLLLETNKVMNLTAITKIDEVMIKHFIDSLLIIKSVDLNKFSSLIDVGTGAGFPGIPIKIMFPHIKVMLLDSLNKRLKFLNNIIDKLELQDIDTIHGRAEDLGHNKNLREKYDICVSRAVANMSTLSEYCIPFVKQNGLFVSYKSAISENEIEKAGKAITILGGRVDSCNTYTLPESDIKRTLVVIKKEKKTPAKYPRKAGIPGKEPIK